ncbi:MAG: hypothetical protein K1X28_09985 [Parachlamydiales bacterium]|nr:hypothetical protein [Parachlamydiales bacterium]
MSINPIRRDPVAHVPRSSKAKGISQSAATAAKVDQVVQLPVVKQTGLRGRQVALLKDATDLSKNIRKNWDMLAPEELAEKIIDLEDRVTLLKGDSPEVAKVVKEARTLHFRFVYPVALELETSGKSMPPSFAKTVYHAAKQVFDTNSVAPFKQLSPVQQQEVIRIAMGGK